LVELDAPAVPAVPVVPIATSVSKNFVVAADEGVVPAVPVGAGAAGALWIQPVTVTVFDACGEVCEGVDVCATSATARLRAHVATAADQILVMHAS
jgi:hypothetical protein